MVKIVDDLAAFAQGVNSSRRTRTIFPLRTGRPPKRYRFCYQQGRQLPPVLIDSHSTPPELRNDRRGSWVLLWREHLAWAHITVSFLH